MTTSQNILVADETGVGYHSRLIKESQGVVRVENLKVNVRGKRVN